MQANHPLTRDDVIERYKKFMEEMGKRNGFFWLGGGSALIMHGLRETTMDLDGGCSRRGMSLAAKIVGRQPVKKTVKDGYLEDCLLLAIPEYDIDLHTESSTVWEDLEVIDGVACYTLAACLKQKEKLLERLNRPKDIADIAAIKKAMGM